MRSRFALEGTKPITQSSTSGTERIGSPREQLPPYCPNATLRESSVAPESVPPGYEETVDAPLDNHASNDSRHDDDLVWLSPLLNENSVCVAVVSASSHLNSHESFSFKFGTLIIPSLGLCITAESCVFTRDCIVVEKAVIEAYRWNLFERIYDGQCCMYALTRKTSLAIDVTGTCDIVGEITAKSFVNEDEQEVLVRPGSPHKLMTDRATMHSAAFPQIEFILRDVNSVDSLKEQIEALEGANISP